MSRRVSLRRQNCLRIGRALAPNPAWECSEKYWLFWVDPLHMQNNTNFSKMIQCGYYKIYLRGTPVEIPLNWFWREIEDWELESLVTAWQLSHCIHSQLHYNKDRIQHQSRIV